MLEQRRIKKLAIWGLLAVGLAFGIIWVSVKHADGLRLRLDFALTFARGVIDPVRPLPTADHARAAVPPAIYTRTPTASPTADRVDSITATAVIPSATPTITPTLAPPPAQARLDAPAYEKQDLNNCGPATLAMLLRYYQWKGDQFTISDEIKPIRGDRNVNVEELVAYLLTRVGWLHTEYRVGGDLTTLRRLVANGFPVMIEEGFKMAESYWPNDDRWAGHYLLITGYNDADQIFITQDSFVSANHVVTYADLDKNWKAFNRVYVLVYLPEQRAQIETLLGADWDRDQNRQNALDLSLREVNNDSTDAFAWFNLGSNLVYFEKYSEAAKAYDSARDLGLPQRMLRYQFGPFFAYFHTGRNEDLLALTEYALKRTPNAEEAMLWRGWALYRQGDRWQAMQLFQDALVAHPEYSDALYALDFVQSN